MEGGLTLARAAELDAADPLHRFRSEFRIPSHDGGDCISLCGNSLGLQPVRAAEALAVELEDWARLGVEGHFHARNPWLPYHERFAAGLAHLTGAKESEVIAANNLTVNLHLLLATFYRPVGTRRKILMEAKAFPSDRYALASQIRFHGGDPARDLIEVAPRAGEHILRTADLEAAIADAGDSLATVVIGGVHYVTGQRHELRRITAAAHAVGATCGFDLAHAIGNVPLTLHADDVDFACWCGYKYLNSGPGAVAGYYIHERFHGRTDLPRFEGWWGHDLSRRFLMEPDFVPMPDAGEPRDTNARRSEAPAGVLRETAGAGRPTRTTASASRTR
jgi:kynureninase